MSKPIKKKRKVVCKSTKKKPLLRKPIVKHLGIVNESGMSSHLCDDVLTGDYRTVNQPDDEECCSYSVENVTCCECHSLLGFHVIKWIKETVGMTDGKEKTKKKTKVRNKLRNSRGL